MDLGKRPKRFSTAKKNRFYLDVKDIMREYGLHFLPAKSLFKFQTVCRDWKLQMSTPFFQHTQSLCHRSISGVFLQNPEQPPSFVPIEPESCGVPDPSLRFIPVPVDVVASSNGLVCCRGRSRDKDYYICNPVLQQWKKLPKPNTDHGLKPAVALSFEPSLLDFEADYKLICATRSTDFDGAIEFEIYSSKERSWKASADIYFSDKHIIPNSSVSANGVVYWQTGYGSLLIYDVAKDKSEEFIWYTWSGGSQHFGIYDGKLCKASMNGRCLILYVLEYVSGKNTTELSNNVRTWKQKQFDLGDTAFGKAISGGGSVLLVCGTDVVAKDAKNIYSLNLKTKKANVFQKEICSSAWCVPYVNSLVSL